MARSIAAAAKPNRLHTGLGKLAANLLQAIQPNRCIVCEIRAVTLRVFVIADIHDINSNANWNRPLFNLPLMQSIRMGQKFMHAKRVRAGNLPLTIHVICFQMEWRLSTSAEKNSPPPSV
jgi:hypothetical protein